ncbi:T9SS type B sorting domain-containing protein [Aquimarina sp. TRL1]|uniref:T9SS type B sorting domain-containing protein n=1 Tax=Aquimarina sp. (strain TRL1) TaxID=2736252 RepID=UPI00158BC4B2|nr:T9SS type B sorting domain-containing protein [Aquimarina sp. TRL1]QKX03450.1 T9SS type B sorting domain-containing protein [Aquimarina sp. TRL1]
MKFFYPFTLLLTLICSFHGFSQNRPTDCVNSVIVCGNINLELNSNGTGINDFASPNSNPPACSFNESQSLWLKVNIVQAGTLAFVITPESSNPDEDYDFAVYGPNVTCDALGSSIRCSSSNPTAAGISTRTGLSDSENDLTEGPGGQGNGFVKSIDAQAGEEYYILVDNFSQNGGFDIEFTGTATFPDAPTNQTTNSTAINLTECDVTGDTTDGMTHYNLEQNTAIILGSQSNTAITYHNSEQDASLGENPLSSPYLSQQTIETIYIRIENTITNCFILDSFTLTTTEGPAITTPDAYEICDDTTDGSDTNGIASFILQNKDQEILNNLSPSEYTITYHLDETDADTNTAPIDKTVSYTNTVNPQRIYARVENKTNSICYSTVSFNLVVNALPTVTNEKLVQCNDTTSDATTSVFNLNQALEQLAGTTENRRAEFYTSATAAISGTFPISNPITYTNTSPNQQLFVRVIDTHTECYRIATLNLEVSNTSANDVILENCDDDGIEDGYKEFILSEANSLILNGISSPNLTVKYYETHEEALAEINEITTFINESPLTIEDETIYARIEDNRNQCYGINRVSLQLYPLPDITVEEDFFLCDHQINIQVGAGLAPGELTTNYSYNWSTGETTETIAVTNAGSYRVTVTNNTTGCSKERTVIVIPSNTATIQSIEIKDAQTNNTVLVFAEGKGNYEYAILGTDNIATYQDDPLFTNVPSGIHTVLVRDKNGCLPVTKQKIAVVGFPSYFTPNGDGFHDKWTMEGVSDEFTSNALIFIFNRHGKLLKQIRPGGNGWDGTYGGKTLPSSEYWFKTKLDDGRVITGSFSLIR